MSSELDYRHKCGFFWADPQQKRATGIYENCKSKFILQLLFSSPHSVACLETEKIYLCMCAYTQTVGTKNISITDEAYKALYREKRKGESFTEAILRLTRRTGKLADCLGKWEMTEKEVDSMFKELGTGWRKASERMSNEVS